MTKIDRGQMAIRPGDKLPNHATLLANHWFKVGNEELLGIVLAVRGGVEPFVTWERSVCMTTTATGRDQQVDLTYWGHYFRTLDDALANYNRRVEEQDTAMRDAKAMRQRGKEDGRTAAAFFLDAVDSIDDIVAGMDSGDQEIIDQLPVPRFGGEFADDLTWEQICIQELERYEDGEDDLFDTYVRAFHSGVEDGIRELHKYISLGKKNA